MNPNHPSYSPKYRDVPNEIMPTNVSGKVIICTNEAVTSGVALGGSRIFLKAESMELSQKMVSSENKKELNLTNLLSDFQGLVSIKFQYN